MMGSLTEERLLKSYPFTNICLDIFGPFQIRLGINKTKRGKVYGVIFTCLFSRAVHLDVMEDYSANGFLQTVRR